jgi:chemotaxis protein histidine kinase CheA
MKEIPNYENYTIDKKGRIYSKKAKKFIKPAIIKDGSLRVNLSNKKGVKSWSVHSLMKEVFFGKKGESTIRFKDGNKANPELSNLEIVPRAELAKKISLMAKETRKTMVKSKKCEVDGCKNNLTGYSRKYCTECAEKMKKSQNRESKIKKRKLHLKICEKCGYCFVTRHGRKVRCEYHEQKMHQKKPKKPKQCKFCEEEFIPKIEKSFCCKKEECIKKRNETYRAKKEKKPKEKKQKEKKPKEKKPKEKKQKSPKREKETKVAKEQAEQKEQKQEMVKRDMTETEKSMVEKFLKEKGGSIF